MRITRRVRRKAVGGRRSRRGGAKKGGKGVRSRRGGRQVQHGLLGGGRRIRRGGNGFPNNEDNIY